MGKRQCDCLRCGAPVGNIGRDLCCRCTATARHTAAQEQCPGCGKDRVLDPGTGRCVRCSRRCTQCGGPVRARDAVLCRACRRRATAQAAKSPCPRCGRPGFLREATGWCGTCSRPGPARKPPRTCVDCGASTTHPANGLCPPCWQRHPDRVFVRAQHLAAGLGDPPPWLPGFVGHIATRHCPSNAAAMVSQLGRILTDGGSRKPQAVLERARRPGRSMGSLARALEDYFVANALALPTDQADRLATARRQRRLHETPIELRPAVHAFEAAMLHNQERARRSGTRPRTDHTIESALATVRDLARFVVSRGKDDWTLVDVYDVEAFLNLHPKTRPRRLGVTRQFFRFARAHKIVLVDPTRSLSAGRVKGFTGRTLRRDEQRVLFRRWASPDVAHPHEALAGILALLHGASSREVRLLRVEHIEPSHHTIRLGKRPEPVPLDPASWAVLQRCLAHRQTIHTTNPHVVVTKGTKAGTRPASTAYFSHLLDPVGVPSRTVRCTRLAELVNTLDTKLVAAAFGMDPQSVIAYLSDHVDEGRLPSPTPNT